MTSVAMRMKQDTTEEKVMGLCKGEEGAQKILTEENSMMLEQMKNVAMRKIYFVYFQKLEARF